MSSAFYLNGKSGCSYDSTVLTERLPRSNTQHSFVKDPSVLNGKTITGESK